MVATPLLPPPGWYPDPESASGPPQAAPPLRWWDGIAWTAAVVFPPMAAAPRAPNRTPAGVWWAVGGGAVLLVFVFVVVVAASVVIALGLQSTDSLDPSLNTGTGLADGAYVMDPRMQLTIDERCSFTGEPYSLTQDAPVPREVVVFAEGPQLCGPTSVERISFTVEDGVASVTDVE